MSKRITRNMLRAALPKLCITSQESVTPAVLARYVPRCGVNYEKFEQLVELWHDTVIVENGRNPYNWNVDLWAILGVMATPEQIRKICVLTDGYWPPVGKAYWLWYNPPYMVSTTLLLKILQEPYL